MSFTSTIPSHRGKVAITISGNLFAGIDGNWSNRLWTTRCSELAKIYKMYANSSHSSLVAQMHRTWGPALSGSIGNCATRITIEIAIAYKIYNFAVKQAYVVVIVYYFTDIFFRKDYNIFSVSYTKHVELLDKLTIIFRPYRAWR